MTANKPPQKPASGKDETASGKSETGKPDAAVENAKAETKPDTTVKATEPVATTAPEEKKSTVTEPNRIQKTILPVSGKIISVETAAAPTPDTPPWTLQQFFNGEIDLDVELSKRFVNTPVMSTIGFRSLGTKTGRSVATLATQDGAATLVFDVDAASREVQLSFTFGSMLTLRFGMDNLSDMDRGRWLELMRREQGGLAFLWGAERWEHDYLICIARKYFTNLYAFSPYNFEAAICMTQEVTKKLLNWLEEFWTSEPSDEEPPKLLTW